jgi:outer membrane lipoprotein LolB
LAQGFENRAEERSTEKNIVAVTGSILSDFGSKFTLVAGLALLCAGCAGIQPAQVDSSFSGGNPRVYHQNITFEGRMSLRYQQNGGEQAVHGSFVWAQTPQQTDLRLLSPLGQTIATIAIQPGQATLVEAGKPPRSADDVDQLTEQALGWPLPVSGLGRWLQGYAIDKAGHRFVAQPQAGDAEVATGATGANSVTTADGWRIKYISWQAAPTDGADSVYSPAAYPKRIDLERTTSQAGDVSIRIVIDKVQAS